MVRCLWWVPREMSARHLEIGERWGDRDGCIKRELTVEGFSVLFLDFSLKTKISMYSPKDRGFDPI